MLRYRIRNWTKFQHYKDRNPPWIKLHVEILASEDWVMLDDASKLLMLACMMVAAKNDGFVPDSPDYIKRLTYINKRPNLTPLIECGFLEIVQADVEWRKQMLAPASALQADARPEKETEQSRAEGETEHTSPRALRAEFDEKFWPKYPKKVGKDAALKAFAKARQRAQLTEIVVGLGRYAASRAGQDAQYTAHAATWLNQGRWQDETAGAVHTANGHDPPSAITPERLAQVQALEAQNREKNTENGNIH